MRTALPLLSLGVTVASISACSSAPERPTYGISEATVVADKKLEKSIQVLPDRLVIPVAGNEDILSRLVPGKVLAGGANIDDQTRNPDGFLRKVVSVTPSASEVVVLTQQASLSDALDEGAFTVKAKELDFASMQGAAAAGQPTLMPRANGSFAHAFTFKVAPRDIYAIDQNETNATGTGHVKGTIHLDEATITVSPSLQYDVAIKKAFGFIPKGASFDFQADGDLDAKMALHADFVAQGPNGAASPFEKLFDTGPIPLWTSPGIPITGVSIGPLNVGLTAAFEADAICTLGLAGVAHADTTATANGTAHVEVGYDNDWKTDSTSSFTAEPTFNYAAAGKADATCRIRLGLKLSLFGVANAKAMLSPFVEGVFTGSSVNAQVVTGGTCTLNVGVIGEVEANLDVFGLYSQRKDLELFRYSRQVANVCAQTTPPASTPTTAPPPANWDPNTACQGQPDGFYCGNTLGGDSTKLLYCEKSSTGSVATCPNACNVNGAAIRCE